MIIKRPDQSEFAPFYAGYIGKVPDSGPVPLMTAHIGQLEKLRELPETKANYSYGEGKWTVKEVLGHLADGERVFSYRLVRIARGDKTPLSGFDENVWAKTAPHRRRRIAEIVDEMIAIRRATLALVDSLDESSVSNVGLANNNSVSARAICWIIAGHTQHHLDILAERYGVQR
jgi:uncharacterized damage-inducible protein DinB